jgi:iron complex transport system permease protein
MSLSIDPLRAPPTPPASGSGLATLNRRRLVGLIASVALLTLLIATSLALGAREVSLSQVVSSLFEFDGSTDQLVIRELRVPRTLLGVLVGSALGVAGVLMQAISRNPLADPGLLGVSAGASLAVVTGVTFFGVVSVSEYVWFAFVGAAIVSVVVYMLGSMGRGGATPVRLTLAGAALAAMLSSFTAALIILNQDTLDQYRFWVVGSLAGRNLDVAADLVPFMIVGAVLSVLLAPSLNALALGEDTALALGTRVGLARLGTAVAITLLCGAAVAACGPIGFIGLVIPHLGRLLCGPDQRWLIPYSALLGAIVLLACDIVSRVVIRPGELPVGITTAFIGGIAFVILVRRTRLAQL